MQRCIISNSSTTRNRSKAGLGRKDLQVNPRLWNGVDLSQDSKETQRIGSSLNIQHPRPMPPHRTGALRCTIEVVELRLAVGRKSSPLNSLLHRSVGRPTGRWNSKTSAVLHRLLETQTSIVVSFFGHPFQFTTSVLGGNSILPTYATMSQMYIIFAT